MAVAVGSFVAGPCCAAKTRRPLAIPKELYSYRDIVKKVLPAVVSIESKAKPANPVRMQRRRPDIDQVPEEFRQFFGGAEQFEHAATAAGRLRLRLHRRSQGRHPDQLSTSSTAPTR